MAYSKLLDNTKSLAIGGKAEEANNMWDPQAKESSSAGSTAATAGDSTSGGPHWRELTRSVCYCITRTCNLI